MLGLYRFVLSLFVVQAHVWSGGSGPLSQHAVFSFYVLSGFLMTLILNQTYGFGAGNFLRFWANRMLRLYPAYWIVVALTVGHILFIGPLVLVHPGVGIPSDMGALLANISMFGITGFDVSQRGGVNFIPNAWSLSVELFSYFLLSIYFARGPRHAGAMLAIGILVALWSLLGPAARSAPDYDFKNHYAVLQAGLIPFALGSLAYFGRDRLARFSKPRLTVLLVLWTLNVTAAHFSDFHRFVSGLYAAAAINAFLVPLLFAWDAQRPKSALAELAGGAAYPIFVSHILIGSLILLYFGGDRATVLFLVAASIATIIFSAGVHLGIERPLEAVRKRVKAARVRPIAAKA